MEFHEEIMKRLDKIDKLIIYLIGSGVYKFGDLLRYTGLARSSLHNILVGLEKAGLIDTKKVGSGLRMKRIEYYLTDIGRKIMEEINIDELKDLKINITKEEVLKILDQLRLMLKLLGYVELERKAIEMKQILEKE